MFTTFARVHSDRLLGIIAITIVVILALLPFHAFFSTWGGSTVGPLLVWKSWKEILLVGLLPLVVAYLWMRPDILRTLWARWYNKLIVAYAGLHALWAVISPASGEAIIAGLMMNLRFLAIFVLAQLVVVGSPLWMRRLQRWAVPWLLVTTAVVSILALVQVFLLPKDFLAAFGYDKDTTIAPFILVDENPEAVRAFATMRGPNTLAAYLLIGLAVAAYTLLRQHRNKLAMAAVLLGLVALFLTGSRSAWLGAITMLITGATLTLPRDQLRLLAKRAAVPIIAIVALGLWAAINVPAIRLAVFHSSPGDSSLLEGSTEKHWQETAAGVIDVAQHPLGQGVGTAGPASFYNTQQPSDLAENYFVQIAQETGVFGLVLFVAICGAVAVVLLRNRTAFLPTAVLVSLVGLTVVNVLLHGWADDPIAMTWWALAGICLAPTAHSAIPSKKKPQI